MSTDAGRAVFSAVARFGPLITDANRATRALTGTRDAAKGIGTASREAEPQITSAGRALEQNRQSATRAGQALGTANAATSEAAGLAGKLRAAQLQVTAARERYNAVLNSGGQATARLGAAEAALLRAQERETAALADGAASAGRRATATAAVATARERLNALQAQGVPSAARLAEAEAGLLRAEQRLANLRPPEPGGFARFREGLLGTVETLGKLGLALGVFELGRKGLEKLHLGNELTTSLNAVQAAAQATDEQMVKVRATAIAMGKDLTIPGATAVDAADAINDLVKSGVALDRALVAARPALLLAAAAQVSIADAARVTGDVMDDFRLPASEAAHVANTLAAASNSAGGGLMDLFDAMKYAGPTARTVGVDLDYTSAALVLMAKSGHQGSIGGTALANMLTRLAPVSRAAKKAMAELGVNAWDAQGKFRGLPVVVEQLHRAQERLSPKAFAQDVQIAFGNRARLAVFDFAHGGAASLDMFYKKLKAGDVQAYANTMNRGLSAAGRQLGKEVASWAIAINGKVQPALARLVFALGDNLPKAVDSAGHTLGPLGHELGAVLVPALKIAAAVLGLAAHGLQDVGEIAGRHTGTIQVLGTVVLGMWAAWKGYTIASTAVRAVGTVVETLRNRVELAGESMAALRAGETAISGSSLALGGLGLALGLAAYAYQRHQAAAAADRAEVEGFTAAIKEDSGALGENTKAAVFNALQKAGAINAAKTFGISLSDLTDASLGNADALGRVNQTLDEWKQASLDAGAAADNVTGGAENGSDAYYKLRDAIGGTNKRVKEAVTGYQDQQSALGKSTQVTYDQKAALDALGVSTAYTVDAAGNLVQAQTSVGDKVDDTTKKLEQQKTAADLLKASWDALNGIAESVEKTQNAFLDSMDGLTDSVKQNGRSLDQNTSAGRKNREQLVQILDLAKEQAQAVADQTAATDGQTAGLIAGNAQLARNEASIRKHAAALGLSKAQTDALIKALGQLSEIHPITRPDVDTDPAKAKAAALKRQIEALQKKITAVVAVNDGAATPRLSALQRQLDAIDGTVARARVLISINNQDVGRAVADAARRASGNIRVPGGHAPAQAAGGLVADGWFTKDEAGWELGYKQGSQLRMFSHADSVRMLPQGPSVPTGPSPAPSWSDLAGLVNHGPARLGTAQAALGGRPAVAAAPARQAPAPARVTHIENVNVYRPLAERTSESLPSVLRRAAQVGV